MTDVIEEITKDDELRRLLWQVFKWRSKSGIYAISCNNAVVKLIDKLYEKTGIDIEQYT